MRTLFRINILIWAIGSPFWAIGQNSHKHLLKGDQAYFEQNFEQAELNYRRALEQEKSTQGTYNLGNATYRQERFDEAIAHFKEAADGANDDAGKSRAFHNLGNAHYQAGQFEESVEAYKNALRLNPGDLSTKQNLFRAIRKLPPPKPEQQPQQGDKQDNQKQQEQDQNQQNQNQQNQQPQPQDPNQSQDQSQPQEDQNQPAKQPPQQTQDLSKEEASKLLEIMDQEEQKVQEKLRKAGAKKKQAKDW